ncbi:hypothetical protein TeGR_g826 [Tetraparma gracilis]|uniref:Uncharacterized protein n=1 Tax=Tetraparma gracilis TaxID=2962635 RepID=A0ABQ6MAM6_9STRA|nr:hypothetical protein TeGR_g826 [Tetraparma gracilis]
MGELLDAYLAALGAAGVKGYTREMAERHFDLGVCDYARFVSGRFSWGSRESYEKAKDQENMGMIRRSYEDAKGLARRTEEALTRLGY